MTDRPDWLSDATPGRYYSYLVRIWQIDPQAGWRALVVRIDSGERHTFTDLAELYRFLCQPLPPNVAPPPGSSTSVE
jgi:hypothetical protein